MAEEPPFRYVPPADPNLGRRFGRYIVRTLLGRGGMGAAYLAEHEARAHVKCVIKFVLAELAQHPMVISRYRTETEAVSLLKHDGIVKLLDFGVLDDGQLFMCFEYIEGKSFDRYVAERGGRLDVRKAAYFIFQLCDALQYAHECGVVHRDLKPDNLMIESNPQGSHLEERVKILDFGIAKVASTTEHTGSGISMGTPRYMAPEQVTNAAAATGAADVFSLATIFYLLVTGRLPWGTPESDVAIYHLQRTEPPACPSEDVMPRDVAAVILRALSIKPTMRPGMREFAVELAAAIPREGDLESGTEILKHVKRLWVTSSLPHVQTLPRPVAEPTTTPVPEQRASIAVEAAGVQAADAAPPVPGQPPDISPSVTDLTITANARPRARAASSASDRLNVQADAALASLGAQEARPPATPSGQRLQQPPTPVLAGLPTGLISQRFAVQELPAGPRAPSVTVASEIEMPAGTPDPQPYAHAALPAVLLSTTQLSGPPPPVTPSTEPAARVEPAPILVLPGASPGAPRARSARNTLLLGCAVLVCAAVGAFVVIRTGPRSAAQPGDGERPERASAPATVNNAGTHAAVAQGSAAQAADPAPAEVAAPGAVAAMPPAPPARPDSPSQSPPDARLTPAAPPVTHAADPARTPTRESARPSASATPPPTPSAASTRENGELAIIVRPWAAIWLNGKPLADGTPYRAQVPAGRYRIRIANEDMNKAESLTVTVEPHKTTIVERRW